MVVNVVATLALAPFYGLYGIVAGTAIGVVFCSIYFLWRFHRLMAYPLWEFVGTWLWRLLAATSLSALAVVSVRTSLPSSVASRRADGLGMLAALGVMYVMVLLVALRLLRFLQVRDLATLTRILPGRLQRLTSLPAVEFLFGARP
jgi:peptidoglycan biosynthesis protein MviN/MurJ (putative lipid II flippase)